MKRKIPKKQLIILCGGVTATIILVSLVMLIIRKAGKNDNIAGTKIVEETTVSLDRTTGMEKETTSKETATSTEQVTTERELETTTEKDTTELTATTTNPPTTVKPTEVVTQPVKEVVTNPPTTAKPTEAVTQPVKEVVTNPPTTAKPTEVVAQKKNIIVYNEDGLIDFNKSEIYKFDDNNIQKILNSFYYADIVKNILGDDYYNSEAHLSTTCRMMNEFIGTEIFVKVNNRDECFDFNKNGKPYYVGKTKDVVIQD